jgi:hypothetical protein
MTQLQIKEEIDKNSLMIETLTDPTQFTLNCVVRDLLARNYELQCQCEHSFVDGVCEYCYMTEEK